MLIWGWIRPCISYFHSVDVHPFLSFSQRKSGSLSVPEAVKYWQVSKLNVSASLTNSQSKGRHVPIAFSETSQLRAREKLAPWNKELQQDISQSAARECAWMLATVQAAPQAYPAASREGGKVSDPWGCRSFLYAVKPRAGGHPAGSGFRQGTVVGRPWCSCLCLGSGGAALSRFKFLSLLVLSWRIWTWWLVRQEFSVERKKMKCSLYMPVVTGVRLYLIQS